MTNKKVMPRLVKTFGYTLYAGLVAALFLFLLFPSQAMESYAARRFNKAFPYLSLSLTDLRPILFGLAMDRAVISLSALPGQPVFETEKVRIKLRIQGLTQDRWWLELAGRTGKGTIRGRFLYDNSTAKIKIRIDGGKFQVPKPVLGIKQVVVRHADADMTIEAQTVRLLGLNVLSDKGAAAFTGSIFVEKQRPDRSRLDLKGSVAGVRNGVTLKNKIGISVTGSLMEPKIRLSGVTR
ncbi:MAG: hypothetical protein JEZ11_11800 [Desulfobacterales bacterium]|nr:hypothetical protein [Desulfobacterales bacterium]